MSEDLASVLKPISPPRVLEDVYTAEQHSRMLSVVRREGPWKLILAQHFASAEEVLATVSGSLPEGVTPTFDMFLSPVFRGYCAKNGTALYPELEDVFYNSLFIEHARSYWNAAYARPESMLFNIQGPCESGDPAHLDAVSFRGVTMKNTPIWLMNIMGKSGLFRPWLLKKAQVITWFYRGKIGGGFTYWPEGPRAAPKRLPAPMWNRGVVVQNEMMYHRAESNGPIEMRRPTGLAFESLFGADPDVSDGWRILTGGETIQRVPAAEMRFLVHWSAEVYADLKELSLVMDQTDDLTLQRIFDIFERDLKARGMRFVLPADPLHDRDFIKTLTGAYDIGTPTTYPAEAPGPQRAMAA
ncbi:MAG TPA: hypothetical protein VKZ79_07440 [Alphaproteobacteria bacterium]|nr:hypothetical protein [Alphaproteobacteria bacterium]